MHRIEHTDKNQLVVEAYPLVLIVCVMVPMLIATVFIIVTDPPLKLIDGVIFYGICIGFIPFHKYKKITFDLLLGECVIYERNLFKVQEYSPIHQYCVYSYTRCNIPIGTGAVCELRFIS